MNNLTIGYLIPEFPGQTHIFFWREIRSLEKLGIHVQIISTRPPDKSIVCHEWSIAAMAMTTYLYPPRPQHLIDAVAGMLQAGLKRIVRCVRCVGRVESISILERARILSLIIAGARVARIARRNEWQHLHSHSCANAAFIALFAHTLSGISYSLTLHGPLEYFGPGQQLKWSNALFSVIITETLKREVQRELPEIAPGKLEVASMGVDVEKFTRQIAYTPPEPNGELRLVSCGRLHYGKGHQDVIEAIALLRNNGFDPHLQVLGEGPERRRLEQRIAALDLTDRVTLRGAVSEDIVRSTLEQAHIFVLGSHEEGIGVAIMEAMALGVPVVATDVGGVHELVRNGIDGMLVPPKEPDAIAKALAELARDPNILDFGKSGRARVHSQFHSDMSAEVLARRIRSASATPGDETQA